MDHECEKCTFVANRGCIVVSPDITKKIGFEPVFINFFTMPKWVGHASFYAFVCHCGFLSVDYPHGYTGPGYLFLTCQKCNCNLELDCSKDREIYEREGVRPPLLLPEPFFARIWMLIKLNRLKKKTLQAKIKTPNLHLP